VEEVFQTMLSFCRLADTILYVEHDPHTLSHTHYGTTHTHMHTHTHSHTHTHTLTGQLCH